MRRDRGRLVDPELHAIGAARDAQMAHLGEVVGVALARDPEHAGPIAIPDGAGIAEVEPRQVLGDVRDDHARLAAVRVEEAHADDVMSRVAIRQRPEHRVRAVEIERHRAGRRVDVAARALGDPHQEHGLSVELRRRGVEDGHDLELRQRRLHVARGDERVLLETPTERRAIQPDRHALCTGASMSSGSSTGLACAGTTTSACPSSSRVSASTRRPTFGQAISLPYS